MNKDSESKWVALVALIIVVGIAVPILVMADCAKHGYDKGYEFQTEKPGLMEPRKAAEGKTK